MSQTKSDRAKEASLVIWQPDRTAAAAANTDEAARLRVQAAIQAAIAYTMGGLVFYFWSRTVGTVALCAGTVILLAGLISPTVAFKAIKRVIDTIVLGVGKGSAYVLLGPAFYLLFAPLGLLLRRGKGDKLARTLEPSADTYWTEVAPSGEQGGLDAFRRQS